MDRRKDSAKSQFDSWSRWYDRSILQLIFFGPTHRAIIESLDSVVTGSTILDVGCGTGLLAEKLLDASSEITVTGVDLAPGMIEHAKKRCARFGDRAKFLVGDSEHLPFMDRTFDAVTCSHSFHHYPNQPGVTAEFARVLKSKGVLLLADANTDCIWGRVLFDGFVNWLEGGVTHCSPNRFRELLEGSGFDVVSQKKGGFIMPWMVNRAVRRAIGVLPLRKAA